MQNQSWLPLTEYASRTGISISTIRRKIKSEAIKYRMEEGRYLILADMMLNDAGKSEKRFLSSDAAPAIKSEDAELLLGQMELGELRWKALDARVSGLAKRMDLILEQMSEVKMLVKIFEEKLDELR